MVKHSPVTTTADDPYGFLALTMLEEAFRNIESYYSGQGTKEELIEGKKAIRWIRRMDKTFRLVAIASGREIESFHQMCLWKINEYRERALQLKNEKTAVVG